MTELLLVKVKGWGFKSLWPAVVVRPSDIPRHIQVKAKGRQVVKFFNTKASDQFGIAPFKETQPFYHNVDPSMFSKKPMLSKAYTDALEYAEANDLCKSQMDVLPEMLFIEIFSHIDWHSRVKLESVSRKWRRILFDRSLRYIDLIDSHEIDSDCMPRTYRPNTDLEHCAQFQQMVRSLVVDKRKLIRKITCSAVFSEDIHMMMMNAITSDPGFLDKLNHLELVVTKGAIRMSDSMSLFNLCIHLNVLKLRSEPFRRDECAELDVSELVHLTELSGNNVLYRNLRAPHLSILEYCNLDLRSTRGFDDSDEFRRTMGAISADIEVLVLRLVLLSKSSNDSTNTITMPKLTKLALESVKMADITIDLQCSDKLRHLVVDHYDTNCHIINFDISLVCLALLNIGLSDDDTFNLFLVSADDHPGRLSLLEWLIINDWGVDRMSRFLSCISPCYTYSLRSFTVDMFLCKSVILSDVDATALLTLIDHSSPHLKITFSFDYADFKYLIELIIAVVCLDRDVHVCILVRDLFQNSHHQIILAFLSMLYDALISGVDLSVVHCRSQVQVECINERFPTKPLTGLIKKIKKKFSVMVSKHQLDYG